MSHPKPGVSFIVPVHNGGENFVKCLRSVSALDPAPDEVLVVVDGSTDGSGRKAEEFGAKVFEIPGPSGPARARNIGARRAQHEILFFMDSDVTVPKDAVGKIQAVFQEDPYLAGLFGSYDDEPFEKNFLSQYKNLLHHYVHQNSKEEASTFWGACGAIRRDIFMEVGGFDTRYRRPAIEDIEMGYRLKAERKKILLVKDLQVKHLKRWDVLSLLKADFFDRALPWTSLLLNKGALINDLNLKTSDRLSVVSVYLLLLSLSGLFVSIWFLFPLFLLAALLLVVNRRLYRFFKKKRGLIFVLKAIPWHWFYFFYGGLAFMSGFTKAHTERLMRLFRA